MRKTLEVLHHDDSWECQFSTMTYISWSYLRGQVTDLWPECAKVDNDEWGVKGNLHQPIGGASVQLRSHPSKLKIMTNYSHPFTCSPFSINNLNAPSS